MLDLNPRDWSSQPAYIDSGYRSTALRGPTRPLIPLKPALAALDGPVFGHEMIGALDGDLTRNGQRNGAPLGERIIVTGRLLDEDKRPVPGALIEIWQANAAGRYIHKVDQHPAPLDPNFFGGGRCLTDSEGRYRFLTIKPGAYPWGNHPNAWRPNHIHFSVFGRQFATRLVTQMYFPDEPHNADDFVLRRVPAERRHTLVARRQAPQELKWNVVLQGEAETVFFDC